MALDPVPLDLVTLVGGVERLPEFAILHWLLVSRFPAVLLPAEDPLGNAVHDVFAVGVEIDLASVLQRVERRDGGEQLHAVVGGIRFAAHWPGDLPAGVIHADLFPDNVFFLGDDLSGLIDFYFACNDFLVYDLSICLNAWCFEKDGAYNITKGKAMIEGYLSVRPLSAEEIAALPVLCRGSALRFFLTRLYDWLTTPEGALVVKKDPLEYLKKLRFHRAVTNASEYGLIS